MSMWSSRGLAVLLVTTLVAATFSGPDSVRADWIRLDDGVQIHGEIVLRTDREITLKSEKGLYTFDLKRVVEIHQPNPDRSIRIDANEKPAEKLVERPAPSTRRNLGECSIDAPWSFTLAQPRSEMPDGSILLTTLEERSTGTQIMVACSPPRDGEKAPKRPVESDLRALEEQVRAGAARIPNAKLDTLQRSPFLERSALFVSLLNPNFDPARRGLQLYVEGPGERLFQVTVTVPESKYQLNRKRYDALLRSLRFPEARATDETQPAKPAE